MKHSVHLLLLIAFLVMSCSEDNDDTLVAETVENKVTLLKIDYLTQAFEGGKEMTFASATDFTIDANYQPPGDFGSIQLMYEELDQPIFDGTIIWMGLGERSYPENLMAPDEFTTITEAVEMPDENLFEKVMYDEFAFYPEDLSYSQLWNAINQLEIVQTYRTNAPNEPIKVFLYTPSVGVGDPADWDYYLILKN